MPWLTEGNVCPAAETQHTGMNAKPSLLQQALRRPWLSLGVLLALLMLLLALLAPAIARYDPLSYDPRYVRPVGPSSDHPLGTDSLGRDVLSRLLYGARISLTLGVGAMLLAVTLGLAVGVTAGYFGGHVDGALMRLTDVVMAFPAILLALALAAVLPRRDLLTLLVVIGFVNWATAARLFRSETLSLRERQYVEVTRTLGASNTRILLQHILPHLLPTLLVVSSLGAAATILLDAGLSFLGIGIPPPAPTWGSMLREAQRWYSVAPWLAFWPGLAVVVTVASFNLIAFDLRRSA
jgi:peptide/nickel transport system permease protein